MPLARKKAKAAPVSGFISNLSSRRWRSPVFIQTGFPTSIADPLLKNGYSLKKPSFKKKIAFVDCPPLPSPATSLTSMSNFSMASPVLESPACDLSGSEIGGGFLESGLTCSVARDFSNLSCDGRDAIAVSRSRCFSAILKVFLVVILALVTKEFAVGITASAIILFFLEFAGKHLAFCPRKFAGGLDENRVNESESGSSHCKGISELAPDVVDLVRDENTETENIPSSSDETQVTESDSDLSTGEKIRSESKRKALAADADGDPMKAARKARNGKLGSVIMRDSFLKKLVPRKFRSSKNGRACKEDDSDSNSESSESKGGGGEDGNEVEDEEEVCSSDCSNHETSTSSLVNSEDMVLTRERENVCRVTKSRTSHQLVFVIVLLGLVGGRTVALLLTIAWFFLAKSVETGYRNLKKMYENRKFL